MSLIKRREALLAAGGALAAALTAGAVEAADTKSNAPPKGPKIHPPPEDEGAAEEEELGVSDMIGLTLRVVKPGQAVTQEFNEHRLTVTVDKNNVIIDIKIG